MKFNCQLKGSTFCDGQILLRNMMAGYLDMQPSDLQLVRDYSCAQDKNCVQVRYCHGNTDVKIGNVNKESAPLIAACMDTGDRAEVIALRLCGSADTNVGMFFTVNTTDQQTY